MKGSIIQKIDNIIYPPSFENKIFMDVIIFVKNILKNEVVGSIF